MKELFRKIGTVSELDAFAQRAANVLTLTESMKFERVIELCKLNRIVYMGSGSHFLRDKRLLLVVTYEQGQIVVTNGLVDCSPIIKAGYPLYIDQIEDGKNVVRNLNGNIVESIAPATSISFEQNSSTPLSYHFRVVNITTHMPSFV